jgi:hypothetical protein
MAYLEELLPEFRKGAKIRSALWSKNTFIYMKGNKILDESGTEYVFRNISFFINDWEVYQKPIDWGYIIENRIPCWFWNIERKVLGILVDYNEDDMYLRDGDSYYQNCRPVHKDEITFYEDEKDGNI